jgi:hypothetical protein
VLVRDPAIDPGLPKTSDLDFLAFTEASDLYLERLAWNGERKSARRPIDVTFWLRMAHTACLAAGLDGLGRPCPRGRDVSYLRLEQAVPPDPQRLCPEVIDDLSLVFAGTSRPPSNRWSALAAVQDLQKA